MERVKYLILGAGISGLSFANNCENDDYLIIEKNEKIGGYCQTTIKNGYVWDCAGHFFHFKTDDLRKKFLDVLSPDEYVIQNKKTYIYYHNKLIDYPFQKNIHQLEKREFIDCLYDLFNRDEKDTYNNFLDMLYGKFGQSITEKFLRPYNEKLYACNLKDLDQNAMGRFFPYADVESIINNMKHSNNSTYNDTFFYPKKGAQRIIEILSNKIDKDKIITNSCATNVNTKEKYVVVNGTEKIYYEYLINTIPLNRFLSILDDKYLKIADKLSYNKVLVFNLGFNKKSKYNKHHWIYFPDKSINFYRIGFYDNILDSDRLSMYIEIGYSKNAIITQDEIASQLSMTLDNLKRIGIIDYTFTLDDYETIIMDPAYVHINTKDDEDIGKIIEELRLCNVFTTGRYGKWTYGSMEDSMLDAAQLYKEIKNNI